MRQDPPQKVDALFDAIELVNQATQALSKARKLLDLIQRNEEGKKGSPPKTAPPVPEWRSKDFL